MASYASVDKLQNMLATEVFSYAKDKKKASGRALGTLVEIVTFYTLFFQAPKGRHIVSVCHNLSCHLTGAQDILRHLKARLGIEPGETTEDGRVTLLAVECLCACEMAPMMQVDDRYEGGLTPAKVDALVDALR
jgi:NADH-quinone oxidoreductase subunit E